MLESAATWLSNTPVGQVLQSNKWMIPAIQTIHILAIAILLSSAVLMTVRIVRPGGQLTLADRLKGPFLPWIWGAVAVLAVTGALLTIGQAIDVLPNAAFQVKMALLACAVAATLGLQRLLRWDGAAPGRAKAAKPVAVLSLLAWIAIVVAGRWIAYS